jgi:hypothetical protein
MRIVLRDGREVVADGWIVTGTDVRGRRFRIVHGAAFGSMAMGYNLWRGSIWALVNGKRILVKRFSN